MIHSSELQKLLDNEEEPLSKRLRIANNAFTSLDIHVQNRETILLKWLLKKIKDKNEEAWNLLNSWLSSEQMKELNRSNINEQDVTHIVNVLPKRLNHFHNVDYYIKNIMLDCILKILENNVFQQYFKYNLKEYCEFIKDITEKIDDADIFLNFLKSKHLFPKVISSDNNFCQNFIELNLSSFCTVAFTFIDNEHVFKEISKILQQCVFQRNVRHFNFHFKRFFEKTDGKESVSFPKLFMKTLTSFYDLNEDLASFSYKLCFHAALYSLGNDFATVYRLIVMICQSIGFNLRDDFKLIKQVKCQSNDFSITKSQRVFLEILNVLVKKGEYETEFKLNDITFSDFLQNILRCITSSFQTPDVNYFGIVENVLAIHPVLLENVIEDVAIRILTTKVMHKAQYENILIVIFEVYAKLHRIQSLISKLIKAVHLYIRGNFKYKTGYEFKNIDVLKVAKSDEILILPEKVLEYFSQTVVSLASWQVMNLFKTFLYHLDNAVKEDLLSEVDMNYCYVEFVSTLVCCFLSSVHVADHTTPSTVVDKFVKSLDDLKEILGNFGRIILFKEHNQVLMRSFLNICYVWAELYLILSYYSINGEVQMKRELDNDYSACNLRYLHPYLTTEQWCLISQRIANFGEIRCKQLMKNLFLQKIRAMVIFEKHVDSDTIMPVVRSTCSNIEYNWMDVISNSFIIKNIVPHMDQNCLFTIAEFVFEDASKDDSFTALKNSQIFESPSLTSYLLYVILSRINKLFKQKRRHSDYLLEKPLVTKVFSVISPEIFLAEKNKYITKIVKMIEEDVKVEKNNTETSIDINKLNSYLDVLQATPLTYYNTYNKNVCLLCILAMLIDLKRSGTVYDKIKLKCEHLIIGLSCYGCEIFAKTFGIISSIQIFTNYFNEYEEMFSLTIETIFKDDDLCVRFEPGLLYICSKLGEEKYLKFSTTILDTIYKKKNKRMKNVESKNLMNVYRKIIHEKYVTNIVEENCVADYTLEAYTILLQNCFISNDKDILSKLLPHLQNYIKIASEVLSRNVKGCLLLYTTLLLNKSKLEDYINENLVMEIWNNCKSVRVKEKEDELSQLIILIFEHVSNADFGQACKDLYCLSISSLSIGDLDDFKSNLKIWNSVLNCNFNPTKTEIWQYHLSLFLHKLTQEIYEKRFEDSLIYVNISDFEINIINRTLLNLTQTMLDLFMITVSYLMDKYDSNFVKRFHLCMSIMEGLWKFRKPLILDRIPAYLQQYRTLLKYLCKQSNSDLQINMNEVQEVSDCAHKLERFTNALVTANKDFSRISPYLIADILHEYEQISLYPNVKIHLNNCVYSLMSLCDQHSVSFSMRVLSPASTELFKVMYENYKKYYKFTGKI